MAVSSSATLQRKQSNRASPSPVKTDTAGTSPSTHAKLGLAVAAALVAVMLGLAAPQIKERLIPVRFEDLAVVHSPESPAVITYERLQRLKGGGTAGQYVLCILGECYDVTAGRQYYASGDYACFIAGDGSRAFATGDFTAAGCIDDLSGLSGPELLGVDHWAGFYRDHAVYRKLGVLEGRYFDATGAKTPALAAAREDIAKTRHAQLWAALPRANFKVSRGGAHEVWCSHDSGGVERFWQGVPRLRSGEVVCVPDERLGEAGLKEIQGCAPSADRCELP